MTSKNHVSTNMHFFCNICDKEFDTDLQKHGGCDRLVQTHTNNVTNFSDTNKVFYDFVLIHNKKFESYTFEVVFKKELDNNSDPIFKTIDRNLFNSLLLIIFVFDEFDGVHIN